MIDKPIMIDGVDVSKCEYLYTDSKYNDKCCSASIGGNCLCKPSEMICIKYVECLKKQLKAKEQECEELKKDKFALELRLDELTSPVNVEDCEHSVFNGEYIACRYYEGQRCDDADFANCMYRENIRLKHQLDQLKAEVKSKTEYIQEQREIIDQYSKEIEMYKKCQGKRASKREEELKAELEPFKDEYFKGLDNITISELAKKSIRITAENCKLEQTLIEIKDIAEKENNDTKVLYNRRTYQRMKQILQKISEVI